MRELERSNPHPRKQRLTGKTKNLVYFLVNRRGGLRWRHVRFILFGRKGDRTVRKTKSFLVDKDDLRLGTSPDPIFRGTA